MIYIVSLIISLFIGGWIGTKVINVQKDKSEVAFFIRWLTSIGIGFGLFGLIFLLIHAFAKPFNGEYEDKEKLVYEHNISSVELPTLIKQEKKDDFEFETLKFNHDSIETATVLFTIAGLALGTLGILWLGHLESTRLIKDRAHDQDVQEDRLLSLLTLGIDLFLHIDKNELDFVYQSKDKKYEHKKYNSILLNDEYFFLLTSDCVQGDAKLEIAYKKHLVSLYRFLYERKNFQKSSILADVHKIIDELKLIYYEKDILLHRKEDNERRDVFIELLKQFNDYNNFLSGNTVESDFEVGNYRTFDKKLSTLMENQDNPTLDPIDFLTNKKKDTELFYEFFLEKVSKEFCELYIVRESNLFLIFNISDIKDMFEIMSESHLDTSKFFNSYFKESFQRYVHALKQYKEIDLSKGDLSFDDYLKIIHNSFLQIDADIKSVKELYSLFYSFIKLHEEFSKRSDV